MTIKTSKNPFRCDVSFRALLRLRDRVVYSDGEFSPVCYRSRDKKRVSVSMNYFRLWAFCVLFGLFALFVSMEGSAGRRNES